MYDTLYICNLLTSKGKDHPYSFGPQNYKVPE